VLLSRGISDAEKPHLRRKLLELIREENNQVAVQLALLISKIARFDYPREWQELFPTLLQKLQSPDVLMTQRVYLVLNQILKELSTKRLAADQRNFAEVHILGFICNLASIEHTALSGEGQEEINGIVLVCSLLAGRSLMCLRCSWFCMCRSHCSILITPGITGVLTHKASFKDFQVSSDAQKVIISLLTKSRLSV
jgi:hypothetical protein